MRAGLRATLPIGCIALAMMACSGDDFESTSGGPTSDARDDRADGTGGSSRPDAPMTQDGASDGARDTFFDARDAADAILDGSTGGAGGGGTGGAAGTGGTATGGNAGAGGGNGGSGGTGSDAAGGASGMGGAAGANTGGNAASGGAAGASGGAAGSAGSTTGSGGSAGGSGGAAGTGDAGPDGSAGSSGSAGAGGGGAGGGSGGVAGSGGVSGSNGGADASDVSLDGGSNDGSPDAPADASIDGGADAASDSGTGSGDGSASSDGGDAASGIAVTLCPKSTVLLAGQSMAFTADVSGTANQAIYWGIVGGTSGGGSDSGSVDRGTIGANGIYIAPATPGVYQVVAKSQQDTSKSDTGTVTVVADNAVATVRGTISAPAGSGRIFVSVEEWQGGGTVLDAPGPYVIRGLALNQSFTNITVQAHRDVAGVGTYLASVDPYGQTTAAWNGTSATGVDITLANPPSPALPQGPSGVAVWPSNGSAVVLWDKLKNGSSHEVPEFYRIYVSTSANPGPDGGASMIKTVHAGGANFALVAPLTNGTPFYFAMSALSGTTESPLSAVVGPVTPAAPAGGHSISGSISFGFPSQGSLNVFAVGPGKRIWGQRIVNPQSPQSFAVGGLPDGRYEIGAFFDRNDDGEAAASEPVTYRRRDGLPLVAVAGADVSNVALSLPGTDGAAWVATQYRKEEASAPDYVVRMIIGSNIKRVDKAVLIAGPGVVPPVDMRLRDDGMYQWEQNVGQSPPGVGSNYEFEVTYEDGKICNLSAAVTAVWTSLPTALQPSGADGGSATPTFVWLSPGSPLPAFWYRLDLWEGMAGNDIWSTGLPSSMNSVVFNDDSRATVPTLTSGTMYSWAIIASDANGNIAANRISFGVP